MIPPLIVAFALAALLVAGCGGDGNSDGADDAPSAVEEAPAADNPEGDAGAEGDGEDQGGRKRERPTGTTIATSESQFGEVLFDGGDQAIYYFDNEKSSRSECYGECADAWPPVLTDGEPRAGGGARQRLLGTTERRDGGVQVTYAGRPLYYYHDEGPGELRCHNVFHVGGLWLAVQPNGDPVPT
ncbi:MAG TPA: hypothetical protein VK919_13995 [Solirubrobacterales bacterium]|nr:hypothetical protein [Solirubrobacterales bacterium]